MIASLKHAPSLSFVEARAAAYHFRIGAIKEATCNLNCLVDRCSDQKTARVCAPDVERNSLSCKRTGACIGIQFLPTSV